MAASPSDRFVGAVWLAAWKEIVMRQDWFREHLGSSG